MFKRILRALSREQKSKSIAKNRLKLILIQDQIGINEEIMKALQAEMTQLLSKYFELESDHIEMDFRREEESMALVANIPVFGLKNPPPIQAQP